MVRTFLKVYMELGSYFLFLQEQIKDIIIICAGLGRTHLAGGGDRAGVAPMLHVLSHHLLLRLLHRLLLHLGSVALTALRAFDVPAAWSRASAAVTAKNWCCGRRQGCRL
jgi:hypothetical protein